MWSQIADFLCEIEHKRRFGCCEEFSFSVIWTLGATSKQLSQDVAFCFLLFSFLSTREWFSPHAKRKDIQTHSNGAMAYDSNTPGTSEPTNSSDHIIESLLEILWIFPSTAFPIWWSLKPLMSDHKQPWILPVTKRDTTSATKYAKFYVRFDC